MLVTGRHSNVSETTTKKLIAQAKKTGFDLLHQLMLCDITMTSDGFFLQRDEGDCGYNRFLGKPSLNDTVLGRMNSEIDGLTKAARREVWECLGRRYPSVWKAVMKYRQDHSDVQVDGYIG
jgi:hypothetical protein